MSERVKNSRSNALVRVSVLCALTGLVCVVVFLWHGFAAWTLGVGVYLGFPLLLAAALLYLLAVLRDLRRLGAL